MAKPVGADAHTRLQPQRLAVGDAQNGRATAEVGTDVADACCRFEPEVAGAMAKIDVAGNKIIGEARGAAGSNDVAGATRMDPLIKIEDVDLRQHVDRKASMEVAAVQAEHCAFYILRPRGDTCGNMSPL